MSVNFSWRLESSRNPVFPHGTSSDVATLDMVFQRRCGYKQIEMLCAMHAATKAKESLWKDIAEKLESLGEGAILLIDVEY